MTSSRLSCVSHHRPFLAGIGVLLPSESQRKRYQADVPAVVPNHVLQEMNRVGIRTNLSGTCLQMLPDGSADRFAARGDVSLNLYQVCDRRPSFAVANIGVAERLRNLRRNVGKPALPDLVDVAKPPNSFVWGDEVMKFFVAHPGH